MAATPEHLLVEFKKHNLWFVNQFVIHCLDQPDSKKYRSFMVRTSDDFLFCVWGTDADTILAQLDRFAGLRLFL